MSTSTFPDVALTDQKNLPGLDEHSQYKHVKH